MLKERGEGWWPEYGFYSWHTGSNQSRRGLFIGETNSIAVSHSILKEGATGFNYQPSTGLRAHLWHWVVVVVVGGDCAGRGGGGAGICKCRNRVRVLERVRHGHQRVEDFRCPGRRADATVQTQHRWHRQAEVGVEHGGGFFLFFGLHEIFFYSAIIKMGINFLIFSSSLPSSEFSLSFLILALSFALYVCIF